MITEMYTDPFQTACADCGGVIAFGDQYAISDEDDEPICENCAA